MGKKRDPNVTKIKKQPMMMEIGKLSQSSTI
jgi:hypothetical protein